MIWSETLNRKICGLFFVALLFTVMGLQIANFATAMTDLQYLPELTIKSDGNIAIRQVPPPHQETQALGIITRNGNIYTLTADIKGYSVKIDCSNIVFDGAGHTINTYGAFVNPGLELLEVTNVSVKNIEVIGENPASIFLVGSNCSINSVKTDALRINSEFGFNTITENNIVKLTLWRGNNNIIAKCNISNIFLTGWSGSNLFTKNNFFYDTSTDEYSVIVNSANRWDNDSVGNYWSDYPAKYLNASEVDNIGIGNAPYVLDQSNIDRYPLLCPYNIEKDQITLPASIQKPENEVSLIPLIMGILTILVIVVAVGLFYYYLRRSKI